METLLWLHWPLGVFLLGLICITSSLFHRFRLHSWLHYIFTKSKSLSFHYLKIFQMKTFRTKGTCSPTVTPIFSCPEHPDISSHRIAEALILIQCVYCLSQVCLLQLVTHVSNRQTISLFCSYKTFTGLANCNLTGTFSGQEGEPEKRKEDFIASCKFVHQVFLSYQLRFILPWNVLPGHRASSVHLPIHLS